MPLSVITPLNERLAMIDQRDCHDRAEPVESAEPTDPIDANDPTLPIEATDPILPIDRTEPCEAIESTESRDQRENRDEPAASAMSASSPDETVWRARQDSNLQPLDP